MGKRCRGEITLQLSVCSNNIDYTPVDKSLNLIGAEGLNHLDSKLCFLNLNLNLLQG